jgi:hypothetical protein
VVPVCKGLRLPKRPQPPQVPVNTPMSGSLHLSLSMVCLAYRIGECAELCTDGAPRAWNDKDVTNGTRPASVLLLSLGGRFLFLYCWACAVCSDIARALLPKNRFQNGAYTSNGLERTLAPNKYTTSSAADDRLSLLRDHRQGPESWWCVIHCSSSRSSADRSSVRAFERITCAASSRESPAMSVSHTNGSMPSVAPIP